MSENSNDNLKEAMPNTEVVAKAKRKRFTAAEKLRILREVEVCLGGEEKLRQDWSPEQIAGRCGDTKKKGHMDSFQNASVALCEPHRRGIRGSSVPR